jgi:ketosteroid isomerase-like protein
VTIDAHSGHGARYGERVTTEQRDVPAVSEGQAFVERFARAWSQCDAGALVALLAADVVLIQPMMPPTRGREAARSAFARLFRLIPDLRATVHRWAEGDEALFIEFTLAGTFGGRAISWPAVDRFELRDGLAVRRVSYFDPVPLTVKMLTRPRGWGRLIRSGFRPSFGSGGHAA